MSQNHYPNSLERLRDLTLATFVASTILWGTRSTVTIHNKAQLRPIPKVVPIQPPIETEGSDMFYDPELQTFDEIDAEIAHQKARLDNSRISDSEPLQQLFENRMNQALEQRFLMQTGGIAFSKTTELVPFEAPVEPPEFMD